MLLEEYVIVLVVTSDVTVYIDNEFALHILSDKSNLRAIVRLLSSTNENTVTSALTTLFYLCDYPEGKQSAVLIVIVMNSLPKEERFQSNSCICIV